MPFSCLPPTLRELKLPSPRNTHKQTKGMSFQKSTDGQSSFYGRDNIVQFNKVCRRIGVAEHNMLEPSTLEQRKLGLFTNTLMDLLRKYLVKHKSKVRIFFWLIVGCVSLSVSISEKLLLASMLPFSILFLNQAK